MSKKQKKVPLAAAFRAFVNSCNRRCVSTTLTADEFAVLEKQPCSYCGGSEKTRIYQIDLTEHYSKTNAEIRCEYCVMEKGDWNRKAMVRWIEKQAQYIREHLRSELTGKVVSRTNKETVVTRNKPASAIRQSKEPRKSKPAPEPVADLEDDELDELDSLPDIDEEEENSWLHEFEEEDIPMEDSPGKYMKPGIRRWFDSSDTGDHAAFKAFAAERKKVFGK